MVGSEERGALLFFGLSCGSTASSLPRANATITSQRTHLEAKNTMRKASRRKRPNWKNTTMSECTNGASALLIVAAFLSSNAKGSEFPQTVLPPRHPDRPIRYFPVSELPTSNTNTWKKNDLPNQPSTPQHSRYEQNHVWMEKRRRPALNRHDFTDLNDSFLYDWHVYVEVRNFFSFAKNIHLRCIVNDIFGKNMIFLSKI